MQTFKEQQDNYLNKPEVKKAVNEVVETLLVELGDNPDKIYDEMFMDRMNEKLTPVSAQLIASSLDDQLVYAGENFEMPPRHFKEENKRHG